MRVFKKSETAMRSFTDKDIFYLNGVCPQDRMSLCSSKCALFHFSKETENTSAYVILGCKAGEKLLYVEEVVED